MIFLDLRLVLLALFFFGISWLYGWGLIFYFKDRFRWSLAAVVGIASIVSCTYVFVWQARGIEPLQAVFDLVIVFLAALPAMTYVDYKLKQEREKKFREIIQYALESSIQEEFYELRNQTREMLREQKETKQALFEALTLWGLRIEAEKYLKEYQRNLN